MSTDKSLLALTLAAVLSLGIAACGKRDAATGEGPAEQAGQKVDQAADKAAAELGKMKDKAGEMASQAGSTMENAADKAGAAAGNMAEKAGSAMEKAGQAVEDKARDTAQGMQQK